MESILVTAKINPDLDGVACAQMNRVQHGEQLALLNIDDVAHGRGFVYVKDNNKTSIVAGALDTHLEDGWTTVTPAPHPSYERDRRVRKIFSSTYVSLWIQ